MVGASDRLARRLWVPKRLNRRRQHPNKIVNDAAICEPKFIAHSLEEMANGWDELTTQTLPGWFAGRSAFFFSFLQTKTNKRNDF